jgi:hypothetical protein
MCAVLLLPYSGADPRLKDISGQTPLHLAVQWGNKAAIHYLLAAGADPNALDNQLISPLYLAALSGRADTTALLAAGAKDILVAQDGTTQCSGYSPLVAAAKKGHVTAVKTLLAAGADPNLADKASGCTPMQAAASCCCAAAGVALLAAGAEVCEAWLEDAGLLKALLVEVSAQEVVLHKAVAALKTGTIPSIRRNLALLLLRLGLAPAFKKVDLDDLSNGVVVVRRNGHALGEGSNTCKTEGVIAVVEGVVEGGHGHAAAANEVLVAAAAAAGGVDVAAGAAAALSRDEDLLAKRKKELMRCGARIQQLQEEVRELEKLLTPAMQEAIVAVARAMRQ